MTNWNEFAGFLAEVQTAVESLGLRSHQDCFYRGHRDSTYKLQPSIFRQNDRSWEEYWKLERRMFYEFRTRARELYDVDTDWDVLFHMQHHGVPTRLLDWTSVLGTALYFALNDWPEDSPTSPCIWILNPYALNLATWQVPRLFNPKYLAREEHINRSYDYGELLLGTRPEEWGERALWQTPLAIYSNQHSNRMFAQNGWFTIHGTDLRPLETIFEGQDGILKKVEIPRGSVPAAREFLRHAGIGHRQMFPDLDGLARSVRERFAVHR